MRPVRMPFNEAPIHESGKYPRVAVDEHHLVPSMRPRFMNRGSLDVEDPQVTFASAFNEAPIHESGKSGIP